MPSALILLFAGLLALWPVAFLLAVLHHSFARRWKRIGQIALLLPLWTIAASVGLLQLAPFLAKADSPLLRSPDPFVAAAGLGFSACCAACAWWLLVRSLGGQSSPTSPHKSVS
jgi:hypothetical protein